MNGFLCSYLEVVGFLASAFLKNAKYIELEMRYITVMVRKGVKKSLPVIIAPEIVAVVALGI